ncbi:hypothetical protein K443DRAFT_175228 [Laccaria amethystina LaAM-08-1]|jgi:hypothetical protein|uniref:Uncharacterized protein n=1 Tax=Laccaria amethystina LaAM-08-1 TaxID=1095629 RepID=A0A0C9WNQ4_9AGAR|nr:hypothetical protein K443DRAFT_175228 [Laccaria amethystina LaAM-08-1]
MEHTRSWPTPCGQQASALGSGDDNDPSALDLRPHSTLDSHSHTTEHDLTALRATLTTSQEALDQRKLGLVARQERIEGMDRSVREVQRAVEYHEGAVGRHEEAIGRREKEVEEEVVERRERDVQ